MAAGSGSRRRAHESPAGRGRPEATGRAAALGPRALRSASRSPTTSPDAGPPPAPSAARFTHLELGPYTRWPRCSRRASAPTFPSPVAPATFADGVACMQALDRLRRSRSGLIRQRACQHPLHLVLPLAQQAPDGSHVDAEASSCRCGDELGVATAAGTCWPERERHLLAAPATWDERLEVGSTHAAGDPPGRLLETAHVSAERRERRGGSTMPSTRVPCLARAGRRGRGRVRRPASWVRSASASIAVSSSHPRGQPIRRRASELRCRSPALDRDRPVEEATPGEVASSRAAATNARPMPAGGRCPPRHAELVPAGRPAGAPCSRWRGRRTRAPRPAW